MGLLPSGLIIGINFEFEFRWAYIRGAYNRGVLYSGFYGIYKDLRLRSNDSRERYR